MDNYLSMFEHKHFDYSMYIIDLVYLKMSGIKFELSGLTYFVIDQTGYS